MKHSRPMRKRKLLLTVLIVFVVGVLGGAGAFVGTRSSGTTHLARAKRAITSSSSGTTVVPTTTSVAHSSPPTTVQASVGSSSTTSEPATAGGGSASPASTAQGAITYTVKTGDTLSAIAAFFNLNGYGDLYDANKTVIGDDPDLIHPGEQITIANGTITVNQG